MLQQEEQKRRHHERLGNAIFGDHAQNGARIGVPHQHGIDAAIEADQCPAAAADMKQRHADKVDVVLVPVAQVAQAALRQRQKVGVAELCSLRVAGRAAGIHLNSAMLLRDRQGRIVRQLPRKPSRVIGPGTMPAVEGNDAAHRFHLMRHLFDERIKIGADKQHFSGRVRYDVSHLGGRQPEVDRD